MVPDYISAKIMRQLKNGNVYTCMGCRSFLTVEEKQKNPDGSYKFYGRFNQGVVTINLVDVACSSDGDFDKFWGSAWSFATEHSAADMNVFLALFPMLPRSCGSMVLLHGLRRARPLTSFFMTAILLSHLDMQVSMRCA